MANQKGGVGKTTTSVNLAAGLARTAGRTLLVDLDPQCNSTTGLGQIPLDHHPLMVEQPILETITATDSEGLDLLPGCRRFEDVRDFATIQEQADDNLRQHLATGAFEFRHVIIDCPPSIGPLTRAALVAADEVLMPIQCEYYAMEGLTQMIHVIRDVMANPNRRLEFGGILMTMFDETLELTEEVEREVREFFGEVVFDTVIPRDVPVSEAPSFGKPVIDYAPRSRGARAYTELCMEVQDRG